MRPPPRLSRPIEREAQVHQIWINGVYQPHLQEAASIPSDGCYETLRTHGNQICELQTHLERLAQSAFVLQIPLPSIPQIASELQTAAEENVVLRIILYADGTRVMHRRPVRPEKWEKPVTLVSWTDPEDGPPGLAKHGQRARWEEARNAARVDEILRLDRQGMILEAGASNVLAVVKGVLRTPPLDGRILPGVTRGQILSLARRRGIPISEAPIPAQIRWDELGLCSTLKGIAAVSFLDQEPQPGLGPILTTLQQDLSKQLGHQ